MVVAVVTSAGLMLSVTRSLAAVASKLVPVIVKGVPVTPIAGVRPVIAGTPPPFDNTVNADALVAEPAGETTVIGPVVAPAGTVATSCVAVAVVTAPATPLKVTMFSLPVDENPEPAIDTAVPVGPCKGAKPLMATGLLPAPPGRSMARMFPTASYR